MEITEDGYVKISKDEYYELIEDSNFLEALYEAGVDNWEGYEQAQEINFINSLNEDCNE